MFDAYAGKTVLVTGHTGFKGGWLCLWLNMLGAKVVGYSLDPPSQPNLFKAVDLEREIAHMHGDIMDFDHLSAVMREHRPDAVFHLAAQALVRPSYDEPRETFGVNVLGTVNVLEAARSVDSTRAIVAVTSDKCYENREWVWGYRETDPMGGHDPYSASKGCAELAMASLRRSFFSTPNAPGLASARAGNVIGGGDWGLDRILPDMARALSRNEAVVLRNPGAIRPWQHVLEPLSGYLLLGEKLLTARNPNEYAQAWNFGPSDEEVWPVERLARRVHELWGQGSVEIADTQGPHEAHRLRLDCSKARLKLGWKPTWSVDQALERTVAWYKAFYDKAPAQDLAGLCLAQIKEYQSQGSASS